MIVISDIFISIDVFLFTKIVTIWKHYMYLQIYLKIISIQTKINKCYFDNENKIKIFSYSKSIIINS